MESNTMSVSDTVDEDIAKAIDEGLEAFNELHAPPDAIKPLWVVCCDAGGEIVGGLQGHTTWDWLIVTRLWVREDCRHQGFGSQILRQAEDAARQRGCTRAQLTTVTFQAPGFYQRLGYHETGRVQDYPPGHDYVWMRKTLLLAPRGGCDGG